MPVQPTYPGVYVQEIPSGVVSISAVATSITLFIGRADRGPLDEPTLILNRTSYEKTFGTNTALGEMTEQVRQFFLNGGSQAYVMRIANGASAASVAVANEIGTTPVLTFTAASPGKLGESIRVAVDYNTSRPETTFNVTAYREVVGTGGQIQRVDTETFKDLSVDPNSPRFVETVLEQQSNLITADQPSPLPAGSIGGFTIAGALGTGNTDVNLLARILAAITAASPGPAPHHGTFDISVDEQPYVTVTLTDAIAAIADIQTAINTALPASTQVAVNAVQVHAAPDLMALRITSSQAASPGTSVRIRRSAQSDDIAGRLQLGADDGAIEVGGGVFLRPAANGIGGRALASVGPNPIDPLATLLGSTPAQVTGLTVNDGSVPVDAPFTLPAQVVNTLLDDATPGESSLGSGRAALDAVVASLNTAFAAVLPQRWQASRNGNGYRIVITPMLPGADLGPSAVVTTFGGGAYVFGAANSYLPGIGSGGPVTAQGNLAAYRLGAYATGPLFPYSTGVLAGSDGIGLTPVNYTDAYEIVRREVDLFNILVLPRDAGMTDVQRAPIWAPASVFCQQRRAVLIVDPQAIWTDITSARAGVIASRIGVVKDYAAIYWPRITIVDPVSGLTKTIDPSGSVAGICARIDASRGVWKAPAGLEAALVLRGVDRRMSNEENGIINPEALNAIRAFANGIVVWGARTMDGFDNSGDTDYRYLPVRRTALMIEESLYRGLQFAVFQGNDDRLWAQIRLAAGSFMNGLFRQGAFQGTKASEAYFVKCDSETTTQTDINLGIVNVLVGFAPLRPAEFVVLTIQQMAGQVQT